MESDIATQVVGLGGANDFTLWNLFVRADIVVKSVIILLIAASIWSWAIIFDKYKMFKRINASTQDFETKFGKQSPLKVLMIIYQQSLTIQSRTYLNLQWVRL